ncbi:ABC transporter permease subunit [Hyphomonas sp.]|uniref:ABC transporter permease n=1 Tax=Hyphomonas sp. TaxID=87 RepID=UPI001DC227B6|nr:ABC transporter permease subunit [Hyphomonas sp.]MBU3922302.1 ABC transporter permease subunit [Alphaproteobacteria bacterium]MBU4060961.1 ABC transporter permease subunit [Alphaproteobacteria bacterium]MBU4166169.1 ABC transporter permease subunit [Alphaproteobacteria bacterium]
MLQRAFRRIPWGYTFRRLLIAIPTMLAIITMAFLMMRAAPGGPFDGERKLPPATEQAIAAKFGLDKPLHEQYLDYVAGVVQGDFGPSYKTLGKSVNDLIADGLPVSLTIGALTMVISLILGTALGVFAGLRQNTAADFGVMGVAMVGISVPSFVIGPILILVFAIGAGVFAVGGLGTYPNIGMSWHNMTLPVLTLSLAQIAIISRLMRASIIETMHANHIRTARAKGLSEWHVITRHALPSAMLPLVSYAGPAMARVMTGSVVIEKLFGLPGLGSYFVNGALNRDYTLVMGAIIVYAGLIILLNLVADILYAMLDPKVKYD